MIVHAVAQFYIPISISPRSRQILLRRTRVKIEESKITWRAACVVTVACADCTTLEATPARALNAAAEIATSISILIAR